MIRKPFIGPAALALLDSSSISPFLAAAPLMLDEQVVTTTRSERPVRVSQTHSLSELLQKVPGVTRRNNGGPASATRLFNPR